MEDQYKAPKLRLKKRKMPEVEVKKGEGPFQEPIGGEEKPSGRILKIKGKKKVKANIMDQRAITDQTAKDLMKESRTTDYDRLMKKMK